MSFNNPYSGDILKGHQRNTKPTYPTITPTLDMVVEVIADDYVGAVVGGEKTAEGDFIRIEDRYGNTRLFKLREGAFLYEGQRVTLSRYIDPKLLPPTHQQSNSGSRKVANLQAKVAAPSRIWVEGVHDAAIVEQVWGHDLRVEGVVVEYIEGLDNLPAMLEDFQPSDTRRVGVLADHLIEGTKEAKLTANLGPHVMVTGHPYIDIWQAVKPASVGIQAWPEIPRGIDWKTGVCQQLGWGSPQDGWRRVYRSVHSFRDLDSSLIGAVEQLIDFVTEPGILS